MMRVLVTGATGFIASEFIRSHFQQFDIVGISQGGRTIAELDKHNHKADIGDLSTLSKLPGEFDCIVHTAYDRTNLQKNVRGLKNLLSFANSRKVKRLVFLSTFAVYDPFIRGTLNEHSPYSSVGDPYSRVKQQCELILQKAFREGRLEIVILQPTIVYGFMGNWSAHAIKSIASGNLYLPKRGSTPCNSIHVSDLAQAIQLGINADVFYKNLDTAPQYLISSQQTATWEQFYEVHSHAINNQYVVHELKSSFMYGNKLYEEILYRSLFSWIGYITLQNATPILKRVINRQSNSAIKTLIEEGRHEGQFTPMGINRLYHSMQSRVDVTSAEKQLGFTARKLLADFSKDLKAINS